MAVALIVAAGSGERLGADRPKALVEIGGRPLLEWSVAALSATAGVQRIVVALPAGVPAPAAVAAVRGLVRVDGGATRSASVARALAASAGASAERGAEHGARERDELVLVHDAARPLLTPALAEAVLAALVRDARADAAIAAAPVTDTVKRVDAAGVVVDTLERSALWAVQTPQAFRRGALERALDVPAEELARATDDAWLIERRGGRVVVVASSDENLKVTTPLDLRVAELALGERRAPRAGRHEP